MAETLCLKTSYCNEHLGLLPPSHVSVATSN